VVLIQASLLLFNTPGQVDIKWRCLLKAVDQYTRELVHWVDLPRVAETRGTLTEISFHTLPFVAARSFFITDVPVGAVRGGHAHRDGEQLLVCMSGRIEVRIRHNGVEQTTICKPDGRALYVKAGVWASQTYLDEGSSLLVFCSHPFSMDSYSEENPGEP